MRGGIEMTPSTAKGITEKRGKWKEKKELNNLILLKADHQLNVFPAGVEVHFFGWLSTR